MVEADEIRIWENEARQGNSLALSKLLAVHHPRLRARVDSRMDLALKAKLEPEDILQQVYLEVFRQIDRFESRGPDSFLNWVLTILENKLIDARRALHCQARDVEREQHAQAGGGSQSYWNLLDQVYADSATPSRAVRREEVVGALLVCVSSLSSSHQEVIRLRFLEGRPLDEVAARLRKSRGAVVASTRRALGALRAALDSLGDFTPGP